MQTPEQGRTRPTRYLSLVLLGGLIACGSGSNAGPDGGVETVTVAPASPALLAGQSQQMAARDQAGRLLTGAGVAWASSTNTVATVSASGLVTGVGGGTTTISATAQGKQGSTSATVTALQFAVVAAGGAHTCGITVSGSTWCWGRNESGQLGTVTAPTLCSFADQEAPFPCSLFPVPAQGSQLLTRLEAGPVHGCGLTAPGAAWCWGRGFSGQLGNNASTNQSTPVAVVGGHVLVAVSAGEQHTCALTQGGAAYCWGLNSRGELGDGTTINRSAPVAVTGGHVFESITTGGAGNGFSCALTGAGAAWCWGQNIAGQLGIGSVDNLPHSAPVPVTGGIVFDSLSAGPTHVCGLTAAGSAWCWGSNQLGELGDGSLTPRPAPVPVAGSLAFAQITAGGFNIQNAHTCARTDSGVAYCWGENAVGALGDGTLVNRLTPTAVTGSLSFTSISAGYRHNCGIAAGRLYCWGSNGAGQLGINSIVAQSAPTPVMGQP
jgi:alpha-tubulin suppressor-like RCC1 family protein